jgi:predicted DCC family thiol-disulfide oxidoreductase YuxK
MTTATPACTLYFDGDCPLCRREIALYRRQAGANEIEWVDAATCDPSAFGPGLDRDAALARIHARAADGTLVSGAAAFMAMWHRLPRFRWLATVASTRPVLALLEGAYSAFLFVRRAWRRTVPVPASTRTTVSPDPQEDTK